jgi:hypothetical protein
VKSLHIGLWIPRLGPPALVSSGSSFDADSASGRVIPARRFTQGKPELITYAADGAQDGLVPFSTAAATVQAPQAAAETGSIRGVITYYFNSNYGSRADVGAEVWLLQGTMKMPTRDNILLGVPGPAPSTGPGVGFIIVGRKQEHTELLSPRRTLSRLSWGFCFAAALLVSLGHE